MRKLKNHLPALGSIGPTVIWLTLFLILPLIYVIVVSFMNKNNYGGVLYQFTLEAYQNLFRLKYLRVFWVSFLLAFETALICILVGYPFAYIIAKSPQKVKPFLVLFLMLPFWINSMIRIYGWNTMLRNEGVINTILMNLGLIDSPLGMLYTNGAVLLGMVYDLLPFAVLPMYTSIEKLDPSLVEAAGDLGASKARCFVRVILPLTKSGIFAASLQTFIPALGLFYISDMMGGAKRMYIGNLIRNQFMSARNWPLGSALSIILIAVTLLLLTLYNKAGGDMEDIA